MQSSTAETQMLRDKIKKNKKPRKRSVFGALWRALTLQRRASPAYARSFAEAKLHGTAFLLNGRRTRKKRREAAQEGRLCERTFELYAQHTSKRSPHPMGGVFSLACLTRFERAAFRVGVR